MPGRVLYPLVCVLLVVLERAASQDPWTWSCVENLCVREEARSDQARTSLNSCLLSCSPASLLWPSPRNSSLGNSSVSLNLERISVNCSDSTLQQRLEDAVERQISLLTMGPSNTSDLAVKIEVNLEGKTSRLDINTAEDYRLSVVREGETVAVRIAASNYYGARHAVETLFQLVVWDEVGQTFLMLDQADISDWPEFPHRGISVDTARNFIPVENIKTMIESLSYSKLNVFHWHLTDSQSFPLQLPSLPEFSVWGAYSPQMVYTPADIRDLVQFAEDRGVRMIPELDIPAHVGAGWESQDPSLTVCHGASPWEEFCVQPPCGQLNPVAGEVFEVLGTIYTDILTLFSQPPSFHLGGDEIHIGCWNSTESITAYLAENGRGREVEDFYWLLDQFWNKTHHQFVQASQRANMSSAPSVILWSSEYLHHHQQAPGEVAVQVWTDSEDCSDLTIKDLAEAGYKLIFSNIDGAYLDCGYAGWVTDGNNWCSPYRGWQAFYENNPYSILTRHNVANMEEARQNILGGEAAIWTEQTDGGNILSKMEPRTAAYGASLWRGDSAGGWREAHQGMVQHRQRLLARGVQADQITQMWCLQNPGLCLLSEQAVYTSSAVETCPTITTTTNPPTTSNNSGVGSLNFHLIIVIVSILISAYQ